MNDNKLGQNEVFEERLNRHMDELKWLFMELYPGQEAVFWELCEGLRQYYAERGEDLRDLDLARQADSGWYQNNHMLGMMLYVDAFAGNLQGLCEKLSYFENSGVNYLHLMSLLDCPEVGADGGYAISDYRKVRSDLGTMEDLRELARECHAKDICLCLDFVMNHTSDKHEWAMKAKAGEVGYEYRYLIYDDYYTPDFYDKTVPEALPTTAPGNFTWNADLGKVVMTTFHSNQWDLNYGNPVVLSEMIYNMLNLANQGIDIIRLDSFPYIWKQIGTNCRNLPQVHNIVRIIRIITEIVCPGILLLGEVAMDPDKIESYFGTIEKPEFHMLYNTTAMTSLWNTVATGDTHLLRKQLDNIIAVPKEFTFQNYLRSHDEIRWRLDYEWLSNFSIEEAPHKQYLNDFFTGVFPNSFARGELFNDTSEQEDYARLCGTTASLCGIEKAEFEGDEEALQRAIRLDLTLHACMMSQTGIPVIYSGDEIGQVNDYSYKEDENRKGDSRNLHRGAFRWDLEELRHTEGTMQQKMYDGIRRLERFRSDFSVFGPDAEMRTLDTWDDAILGISRYIESEQLVALFNFSGEDRTAWIDEGDEIYIDTTSGQRMKAKNIPVPAYGFCWLLRSDKDANEQFKRTEMLIGREQMEKLFGARVAVFGLGGVGGYVVEALARSGIGTLDLIDPDKIENTNLNRQILATWPTVGQYKVDAAMERILQINPNAQVHTSRTFFLPETADQFDFSAYDYIVDAIDTVTGKVELAVQAVRAGTPIISCMGAGNRMEASAFEVADVYETSVCPMARVMRRELKKRGIEGLKVVYSSEPVAESMEEEAGFDTEDAKIAEPVAPDVADTSAQTKKTPGSNAFAPGAAGLILAGEVVKDLIK